MPLTCIGWNTTAINWAKLCCEKGFLFEAFMLSPCAVCWTEMSMYSRLVFKQEKHVQLWPWLCHSWQMTLHQNQPSIKSLNFHRHGALCIILKSVGNYRARWFCITMNCCPLSLLLSIHSLQQIFCYENFLLTVFIAQCTFYNQKLTARNVAWKYFDLW